MSSVTSSLERDVSRAVPGLFLRIIDDYYEDPDAVRRFAESCQYDRPFTGNWRGLHSLQRHPDTHRVVEDIASKLEVSGRPNWDEIEASYQFWNRPSAGIFALLYAGQSDAVHSHKRNGRWAGLCYLSLPDQYGDEDGLYFYRHRDDGVMTCRNVGPDKLIQYRNDGRYTSRWDQLALVPMKYNRMVIFDGQYFHAASAGFGSDPMSGRLAQLFAVDMK